MTRKLMAAGVVVIAAMVLVSFYPTIKIGFFGDDWWEVANAGKMSVTQFLRFYFDPMVQTIWYRPAHGLLLLMEYWLLGADPEGYHLVQILIHIAGSVLLLLTVYEVSRRWRLAFVAALLYAVLYPGSIAVFGIAVHDPLAELFYMAAVLCWVMYLKRGGRRYFALTVVSFILALLGKETSVGLIVTMLMVDVLFLAASTNWRTVARRYAIFGAILLVYLAIEYRVQTRGHFTNEAGYSLGPHMIENGLRYLALSVWPFDWGQTAAVVWLGVLLLLVAALILRRPQGMLQGKVILFLAVEGVLGVAPVLGLPVSLLEPRYLYPASVAIALFFALVFQAAWTRWASARYAVVVAAVALALVALLHGASTADSASAMAEFSRQQRVPFRDIVQAHPAYPPDTYIYFMNPPYLLRHFAPSVFFFRYGSNVTIGSSNPEYWGSVLLPEPAELRTHTNAYVYAYDEGGHRREISVDRSASATATPDLPVNFGPIRLEGYELTSTKLERGQALALLLYWRAQGPIGRDYTVFVHLVNGRGEQVAGADSGPRNGSAPTSKWVAGELVVDGHVVEIPEEAGEGEGYRVEVGLYYLPTMERLGIVDGAGREVTDTLVLQPFSVGEYAR